MRALLQRVTRASVVVEGSVVGEIGAGLLILLGVAKPDTIADATFLVEKILNLRVFQDADGKMNRSLFDTGGSLLVVSQFTLYGDCRKGRRPSFTQAAQPEVAQQLYEAFLAAVARHGVPVAHGTFGAHMAVSLVNDGPVTLLLESPLPEEG